MQAVAVIILSLFAGWAVNLAADALPEGLALRDVWRRSLRQLLRLPTAPRPLLIWVGAVVLGWLAYMHAGWSLESLITAVYAWFFLAVAVIDFEHRRVLNRMLLAAVPCLLVFSLAARQPSLYSALLGGALGL